jgi:hypothetical protein
MAIVLFPLVAVSFGLDAFLDIESQMSFAESLQQRLESSVMELTRVGGREQPRRIRTSVSDRCNGSEVAFYDAEVVLPQFLVQCSIEPQTE